MKSCIAITFHYHVASFDCYDIRILGYLLQELQVQYTYSLNFLDVSNNRFLNSVFVKTNVREKIPFQQCIVCIGLVKLIFGLWEGWSF